MLNGAAAAEAGKHAELYLRKGLLVRVLGAAGIAAQLAGMRGAPTAEGDAAAHAGLAPTVAATLAAYSAAAEGGPGAEGDAYGKVHFANTPLAADDTYLVGRIVPVLYYCMGGVRMDGSGAVLKADNSTIANLHAVGEVTGGVHGNNRLGGNSLLECTVFGSIVGEKLAAVVEERRRQQQQLALAASVAAAPAVAPAAAAAAPAAAASAAAAEPAAVEPARQISAEELEASAAGGDTVWVSLYGKVYDLTAFAEEHPAGPESITKLAGQDGTAAFEDVHNAQMLSEFEEDVVGVMDSQTH